MPRRDWPKSGQFPRTAGGVINTEPRNNGPVPNYRGGYKMGENPGSVTCCAPDTSRQRTSFENYLPCPPRLDRQALNVEKNMYMLIAV